MTDSLDYLARMAEIIEDPVYTEKSIEHLWSEQTLPEFPQLDETGQWYYYLLGFDENQNLVETKDKNGSIQFCPMWSYHPLDVSVSSVLLCIEAYRLGVIEFSDACIVNSRFNDKVYIESLLDWQSEYFKELEKHTIPLRQNPNWYVKYVSGRKSINCERRKTLLDQ